MQSPIPYLPSIGLCRRWLALRLEGFSSDKAWQTIIAGISRRKLAQTLISGANGQPPLLLSPSIVGGSRSVKRINPIFWQISLHGNWPILHLRALQTAYFSTPYFRHFSPEIEEILLNITQNEEFSKLTSYLFKIAEEIIGVEKILAELQKNLKNEAFRQRFLLKDESENADLTIFDVIFRKGQDTIRYLC